MEIYLKTLVVPLLNEPEVFTVSESQDDRGTLLTVSVSKSDMGRVIGRSGETVKSIRNLLHCYGSMQGLKVSVKIKEPIA